MLFKRKSKSVDESELTKLMTAAIVVDGIKDAVIMIGADSNIRIFNPGAERLIGWVTKDALNLHFDLVIKFIDGEGKDCPDNLNPIKQALISQQPTKDDQIEVITRGGKRTPVAISCSPLINQQGQLDGVVCVLQDISQKRQRETQRTEFISTASHEMRTPIAATQGFLELALNNQICAVDDKARGYLEKAKVNLDNVTRLFQDLLTTSKSEDGKLVSKPRVVEVGSFLKEVTEANFFIAEKKKLTVRFLIGAGETKDNRNRRRGAVSQPVHLTYYAYIDPDRIREVITNLFDNAIKYTQEGEISVSLDATESIIQIKIKDSGIGISAEDIPHLFEKFYRVNSSETQTIGGTGLGLFICKKILELYDGKIWAESSLGAGSTFYITLPRLSTEVAQKMLDQTIITPPNNQGGSPANAP